MITGRHSQLHLPSVVIYSQFDANAGTTEATEMGRNDLLVPNSTQAPL
jgi:hypothetical protein